MWMLLMLMVLNFQYLGASAAEKSPGKLLGRGPASPAQGLALGLLGQAADYFLEREERHSCFNEWNEELRGQRMGYDGTEASAPEYLTLAQIRLGLPAQGVAASISPLPWCSPLVREFLVNPSCMFVDPAPSVPSINKLRSEPAE